MFVTIGEAQSERAALIDNTFRESAVHQILIAIAMNTYNYTCLPHIISTSDQGGQSVGSPQ